MQKIYCIPSSGQIIGEIFHALPIAYPEHLKKEIQRYFHGDRIDEANREEILYILVDALLNHGIMPTPDVFKLAFTCKWAFKHMFVRGIEKYANRWDSTCAKLRCWAIPDSHKEDLLVTCLRLATIDLALRLAAFRHLSKMPPPEQGIPLWAKRGGGAIYLTHLRKECRNVPSASELAGSVGVVHAKTVNRWFRDGQRPSPQHIEALAKELADRTGKDPQTLLAEMNRYYAFAYVCHGLSTRIGSDRVMELVGALYHQTARLQRFFDNEDSKPVEENYSHYLMQFISGVGSSTSYRYIDYLWNTEHDLDWQQDIVCVKEDWFPRIVQTNLKFTGESILYRGDGELGSSTHFDYVSAAFIDHMVDCEMALKEGAGPEAHEWSDKVEAEFRRAIELNPDGARAHLNLGTYLGINSWFREKIQEGFRECCRAAELQPGWDLPRIEAANILLRTGDCTQALNYLEIASKELPEISPRLAYTIGFAKMMSNNIPEALAMFEKAIEMKSDYALAFDNAAYCSFRLEDTIKGKRYAKDARQLGILTAYDRYDVGKRSQQPETSFYTPLCERVPCQETNCPDRDTSATIRDKLNLGRPFPRSFFS